MDREPLEPAVLAVELFQEENRERKRHGALILLALSCAVLGGFGVFAFLKFMPTPEEPASPLISKPLLGDKPTQVATNLYAPPPTDQPLSDPNTVPSPSTGTNPPPSSGQPTQPPEESSPFNPLSGAIISQSGVPQDWQPGQASSNQDPSTNKTEKPPVKSEPVILLTGKLGGSDPQLDADQVAATLRGAGANVTVALHYNLAGSVIGANIIASVPPSGVSGISSMLGFEPWKGSVEERLNTSSGLINGRLRELRVQEASLKAKYEEDATAVVVVKEEIQKLNQGLSIIRASKAPGSAIVVIGIGSL